MSSSMGDSLPPRGPKKTSRSKVVPPLPQAEVDEPTTFRANPNSKVKAKASTTDKPKNPGRGPTLWERIFFGKVSSGQLAIFCRQFAAYMNAGVDIGKSLAGLQKQFASTALGPVIGRLLLGVRRGEAFAESVAAEPQTFDALFVGMVKVAEARGGLPETLRNLSKHYENRQSLIRQARAAMIYPIAVLMLASLVVAGLTIWILPMFAGMLKELSDKGAELPLPSQILMGISSLVKVGGWFIFPVVMIGIPVFLFQAYKTAAGKRAMDGIALIIPVFGPLLKKIDTSRFARTLSALLNAGVDVGASLDLTADVLRLDPFRRAVRETKSLVINGDELSVALDSTGRFGPDVIAVVNSGEETGKLPETLDHLANDYEEQVAAMVKSLGQLVQPMLLVMLGGIVLFIILAFFLPYISLLTNISKP